MTRTKLLSILQEETDGFNEQSRLRDDVLDAMEEAYLKGKREQLTIPVVSVSTLLEERKQWYLENEYKDYKDELPLFIQLKLDTDLRRDKSVFDWLYSRQRLV